MDQYGAVALSNVDAFPAKNVTMSCHNLGLSFESVCPCL